MRQPFASLSFAVLLLGCGATVVVRGAPGDGGAADVPVVAVDVPVVPVDVPVVPVDVPIVAIDVPVVAVYVPVVMPGNLPLGSACGADS